MFLGPILDRAPWPISRLVGRPVSQEEIFFRRHYRHDSRNTSIAHIKFVLEDLARKFTSAMNEYHRWKNGYDVSCRGQRNTGNLELRHDLCRGDILKSLAVAKKKRDELVNAWNAALQSKKAEMPSEEMISSEIFPLSGLRKQLEADLAEIDLPVVWESPVC